jgi:molybdate transport system ATP-binding protein
MSLIALKNLKIGENFLSLDFQPQHLYEITGPNGSGKSYLARVLCGKVFNKDNVTRNLSLTEISYTDFTADGSVFQYASSYYQERYQSGARVESIKVIDFLKLQQADPDTADFAQRILPARLLNQEMIELSSGETRKVLIAKTLLKPALIYILDNPFTGLDAQSARDLSDFLRHFHTSRGCCLVVLTVKPHFESADDVLRIDLKPFASRSGSTSVAKLPDFSEPVANFERVFDIRNAQIRAGEKVLLSDVNWCVRKGEKWLLQGPNGSGKTTLTSLMYADNPNAYAQDLVVFDKKRGSGESIWQIKARIGFVSPEIQNFWPQSAKVIEVIRSGLSGTQVLVRRIQPAEQEHIEALLQAQAAAEQTVAERQVQIDSLSRDKAQLTRARDEQTKLATDRQAQVESLTKARAAAEQIAAERAKQIDVLQQAKAAADRNVEAQATQAELLATEKAQLLTNREALAKDKADLERQLQAQTKATLELTQLLKVTETDNGDLMKRQHLLSEELLRAEVQIELIKDLLLREPGL